MHRLAARPDIPALTRPHFARWARDWQKSGGEASAAANLAWFETLGRPHLRAWQFRQALQAVELWCREIARCCWAASFDWNSLRDQARQLESN